MLGRKLLVGMVLAGATLTAVAHAENAPGVTPTEIKIGQPMPYSGPAAPYGAMGRAQAAYFKMINEHGGIHGRKIDFITLDDGFNPAKTMEITRKLVEGDKVAFIFGPLGTPANVTIRKYLNEAKVPQIYPNDAAGIYHDPDHYPWTIGAPTVTYFRDGTLIGQYIVKHKANGKIAVLYINNLGGQELLDGLKKGLGTHADMIVKTATYEATDPSIDSQIIQLQASGADIFVDGGAGKQGPMAIRKTYDLGWKPLHLLWYVAASINGTLEPAGLERSVGIISHAVFKEPADSRWKNDQDVKDYLAWMNAYYPQPDAKNLFIIFGWYFAKLLVQALDQCGDDLSRENIARQTANVKDPGGLMFLPGLPFNADPDSVQTRLIQFDGKGWELLPD